MLSVSEAKALVCAAFRPVAAETVSVAAAAGRVLASDVAARVTQPPWDVSAMDGYAVRAKDTVSADEAKPVKFHLVGESAAGCGYKGRLEAGQAVRISTGAPVPDGADAIVIQEEARRDADRVTVLKPQAEGRWIRRAGLDFHVGDTMLTAGQRLTARDVGLAAAINVPWLRVRRKPRVAFVATGDEVVMPGDPLGRDQIISSNSVSFAAYMEALGATPIDLGIARDSLDSLRSLVEGAKGSDLLVTMGGASVGDHDLVRRVLGEQDFDVGFYRIAMRPGKPLLFGRLGDVPVLGLPGNPVSVGVTTVLFVRAAVELMLGREPDAEVWHARLGSPVSANDEREEYLRARLQWGDDGHLIADPFDRQDSSMLALFARADGLVIRPPLAPALAVGDGVSVIPLRFGHLFV